MGLGCEGLGPGYEVLGLGFEVLGLGYEVLGLGYEVTLEVPASVMPRFARDTGMKNMGLSAD